MDVMQMKGMFVRHLVLMDIWVASYPYVDMVYGVMQLAHVAQHGVLANRSLKA